MPRKSLIRSDRFPYHVTARSNNREPFHLALDKLWPLLGSEIRILSPLYEIEVQAFVLMPNHFHLLVTTPGEDLGVCMNLFMSEVTKRSNRMTGRSGHVFGGPYHWTLINSTRYFRHVLKYVYRNPAKAGIVDRVENYPYSTLRGLIGEAWLPFPVHFTRTGMEVMLSSTEPLHQLDWLNTPFPIEAERLIQQGLRKTFFEDLKSRSTRKPYPALDGLI